MAKHCPKCGNTVFHVTAHVTQTWEVDEDGDFIRSISNCDDVTHRPDDQDIWTCAKCGHDAPGSEFNEKG